MRSLKHFQWLRPIVLGYLLITYYNDIRRFLKGLYSTKFYHCQPLHSMLVLPKVPLFDLDQGTAAKGVLPSQALVKTEAEVHYGNEEYCRN
jgi:hypothetical protein